MAEPHGGHLIDRTLSESERKRVLSRFSEIHHLDVTKEIAQEIYNIAHGVFSPLEGFLTRNEFESVLRSGRLTTKVPWTIPIVLDVDSKDIVGVKIGDEIGIVLNGMPIAKMDIEDIFTYDKLDYAKSVFGTDDEKHPGVQKITQMKENLIGGKISLLNDIGNPYPDYTLTPKQTRELFTNKGWRSIVAFQTRNTPHLGHEYVQKTALSLVDGLFVNPLIGKKKAGDFTDEVIIESYKTLMENYYPESSTTMSVLHTEMRYGGPKEAIHHAIMRKNFGCTHFIVGRDHAGVGDYYGPFDAHKIFDEYPDLGITPIMFRSFFFCKKCNSIANDRVCPHGGEHIVNFAGRKIREMLENGQVPSGDMMRPEVANTILKYENPFVVE
ncbi:sulfate adenylyltransferase [Candidatus Thorarchaeota archaeon]|nr:MAG: sulfate adenylyltransferase [Candidatus Thorarchaeota archaeon]